MAYQVFSKVETNPICVQLFDNDRDLDLEHIESTTSIIGDLVRIIVNNLSSLAYSYTSMNISMLDMDDYNLLASLLRIACCLVVAVSPSRDLEMIQSSLSPLLSGALELIRKLLVSSLPYYFNFEYNKYPLRLVITLSKLIIPGCVEPFIFDRLETIITEAIKCCEYVRDYYL